jgi:high-affinity iron transporter
MRCLAALWLVLWAGASLAKDVAGVQRLLGMLGAIGQEYTEAFDEHGALVRPIELDEARLLLADARTSAARLAAEGVPDLGARLDGLEQKIGAHAPVADVTAEVRALRETIEAATGVREDIYPRTAPSPTRGQAVYRAYCATCHGESGAGDGPGASELANRPADFTDPDFMRGETPSDFFRVVSLGRRQSAMPAWEDSLSIRDRWDVIGYIWTLGTSPDALAEGQRLFAAHCASCHGATGDGRGVSTPVANLRLVASLADHTDGRLHEAIADGVAGRMPGFADVLGAKQRANVVALVRALSLGLPPAPGFEAARSGDLLDAIAAVRRGLDAAAEAYRLGEADASDLAADAYLVFEPLEPDIARHDPAVVLRAEQEFLRLRTALRQPGNVRQVEEATAGVKRALDAAAKTAEGGTVSPRFDLLVWAVALAVLGLALWYVRRRVTK